LLRGFWKRPQPHLLCIRGIIGGTARACMPSAIAFAIAISSVASSGSSVAAAANSRHSVIKRSILHFAQMQVRRSVPWSLLLSFGRAARRRGGEDRSAQQRNDARQRGRFRWVAGAPRLLPLLRCCCSRRGRISTVRRYSASGVVACPTPPAPLRSSLPRTWPHRLLAGGVGQVSVA
jgi:hypothetical protein